MTAQQEGGSTPVGMVAYCPEHPDYPNEPKDWDQGPYLCRDGKMYHMCGYGWRHGEGSWVAQADWDRVAYTPRTPAGEGFGVGGHTPTPWAYRPQKHDDWGVIRTTVASADGWYPVVAVARYVGNPTDADLGDHRRNKTDPSYANAAFIVHAVNSHAGLVEALRPFAAVAEHDIGEDEADVDLFRPASKYNQAPLLTVGDLRRALAALARSDTSEGGGK